jgi:hypothetical protein
MRDAVATSAVLFLRRVCGMRTAAWFFSPSIHARARLHVM